MYSTELSEQIPGNERKYIWRLLAPVGVSLLANRQRRAIHDYVAGTILRYSRHKLISSVMNADSGRKPWREPEFNLKILILTA